jgi:hypothetical protein
MRRIILGLLLFLSLLPLYAVERWIKTYDPFDIGYSPFYASEDMMICEDGGYAMNGTYMSDFDEGFFGSAYLMKTDAEGNLQWAKLAQDDTSLPYYNDAMCFTQTPDGGFLEIIDGTFSPQHNMIKRNANGDLEWVLPVGNGTIQSMVRLSDNSYLLAGYYNLAGDGLYLLKLNPEYEMVWERHYLVKGHWGLIRSICVSNYPEPESGFIGIGEIHATDEPYNWIVLTKFNAEGDTLWTQVYGGGGGKNFGLGVLEDHDGYIYTADNYTGEGITYNSMITKRNDLGEAMEVYSWEQGDIGLFRNIAFGITESQILTVSPINLPGESGCLLFGSVSNLSVLDWSRICSGFSYPLGDRVVYRTEDGGFIYIGQYQCNLGIPGAALFKTDENGQVDVGELAVPRPDQTLTAYPNPFNPSTTVSFTLDRPESCTVNIYNTRGQLVRQLASGRFDTGDHSVTWDGSDDHGLPQSTGVYLIRLQAGTKTMMKRVTLLK